MTQISLYDSYRRKKALFAPQDPNLIKVYCCGPTVYAPPHIGNARAAVVADLLVSLLRNAYGTENVVFARNFTDIDDKIMAAAREENVDIEVITNRATKAYLGGLDALGCARPDIAPRATAYIAQMQDLISSLLERGHAYAADGHVLFETASFDRYGQLSGLDRDSILAGARVEVAPYKRDAADFVLWKPSADDEPGWAAPATWSVEGRGRPGWHLECSAMIKAVLGETIDIHLGGQDLRFPHHENEIAQSCCALGSCDTPLANFWVHNGMLRFGGEKMSKSLGNIQTPQMLLEHWPGEVLRFALLTAHYRQPLEWTEDLLTASRSQLDRLYRAVEGAEPGADIDQGVLGALADDLNTPQAIASLHRLRDAVGQGDRTAASTLLASGQFLGFFQMTPNVWFRGTATKQSSLDDAAIEALIEKRQTARKDKDFAEADRIRDALAADGIVLEDGPNGVGWRRTN
ncbi:MAG: cysteine--tRNA ligase [Parvularcula sp.]